ncbi:hypothetical protein ACI797_16310 [Geodermatophilus sp. SYSU D00691]
MLIESLLVAGVVVLPLPALVLGVLGVRRHRGHSAEDRASLVVLIALRVFTLLLVFLLSGVVLLAAIGAMVRDLELPSLVYTFFVLDLLLGLLILLTFGRRDRRRVRRPANPAAR